MPTPVKSPSPVAAAPARAPVAASAESSPGETFQQELVRRRRSDRADEPAARKAEPKRTAKPKNPTRPARGEPAGPAEEPAIRQSSHPDQDDAAAVRIDDTTEPEKLRNDTLGADGETSTSDEGDTKENDAASLLVGASAAPTADHAPAQSGPEAGDAEGVVSVSELLPRNATPRPLADSAAAGGDEGEGGEAASGGATEGALSGGASALFAETARDTGGAGGETAEQRRDGGGGLPVIETPDDIVEVNGPEAAPAFQLHATAAESDAVPTVAVGSVAAAIGDMKPDARHAAPTTAGAAPATALPPEARFAADNHESIVTSMRGELLPNGGSMRIRLDPPQLGALQVTVHIEDGFITAAFETTNDEATRLLGHSLNQLKSVLESYGVTVDKLHVQQAPREAQTSQPHDDGPRDQGSQSQEQEQSARQEQQRREMLRKLWQRLTGGQDPLDLTA